MNFIDLEVARWHIASRWLLCVAVITAYLIIRSSFDPSWDNLLKEKVWHWIIPHICPTTGLILAILGANAVAVAVAAATAAAIPTDTGVGPAVGVSPIVPMPSGTGQSEQWVVRKNFTKLTVYLLYFYLAALFLPFIATAAMQRPLAAQIDSSNYWLGPLQGLCDLVIGIVFFTKQKI